jgi:hypothetical protein
MQEAGELLLRLVEGNAGKVFLVKETTYRHPPLLLADLPKLGIKRTHTLL